MAFKLKISRKKIKLFKVDEIGGKALAMSAAIFGLSLVFTGAKPHTAAEILALVTTYNSAKGEYKVGGLLMKPAYLAASAALLDCILDFAPYVDGIANGVEVTSDLSTLPNNKPVDYAALIAAGGKATGVKGVIGLALQIVSDCIAFGTGVSYFVILSETLQLPDGFTISSSGQVCMPAGMTNRDFVNVTKNKKKRFSNLTPNTQYYLYYVLVYGETVGLMSAPVTVGSGVA